MSNTTRKTANGPRSGSTTASKDRSRPGSATERPATSLLH